MASRESPAWLRAVLPAPACRQLLQRAEAVLRAEPTLVHVSCPSSTSNSTALASRRKRVPCMLAWSWLGRRTCVPPSPLFAPRCICPSHPALQCRCAHQLGRRSWWSATCTASSTTCWPCGCCPALIVGAQPCRARSGRCPKACQARQMDAARPAADARHAAGCKSRLRCPPVLAALSSWRSEAAAALRAQHGFPCLPLAAASAGWATPLHPLFLSSTATLWTGELGVWKSCCCWRHSRSQRQPASPWYAATTRACTAGVWLHRSVHCRLRVWVRLPVRR